MRQLLKRSPESKRTAVGFSSLVRPPITKTQLNPNEKEYMGLSWSSSASSRCPVMQSFTPQQFTIADYGSYYLFVCLIELKSELAFVVSYLMRGCMFVFLSGYFLKVQSYWYPTLAHLILSLNKYPLSSSISSSTFYLFSPYYIIFSSPTLFYPSSAYNYCRLSRLVRQGFIQNQFREHKPTSTTFSIGINFFTRQAPAGKGSSQTSYPLALRISVSSGMQSAVKSVQRPWQSLQCFSAALKAFMFLYQGLAMCFFFLCLGFSIENDKRNMQFEQVQKIQQRCWKGQQYLRGSVTPNLRFFQFKKQTFILAFEMDEENGTEMLGAKKLNYEFLMLVRDKKYPEALTLGKKILEVEPNNPAVKKFCDFILSHNKELQKMVKEEEEYQEVGSDQSEEEEGEEGEEDGEKPEGEKSSSDEKQSSEDEEEEQQQQEEPKKEKASEKIELKTCTLNQIPHICTRDHS